MTDKILNTPENQAKIREVANDLQGTSDLLDDALQRVFGDDQLDLTEIAIELLDELDSQVLQCEVCGWWCETHELDDDQVCGDCHE